MNVFRTNAGKQIIRQEVKKRYSQCLVPTESLFIESKEFGITHVLAAGNTNAPALVLLHGTSSNSANWLPYFPGWAKHFRIYAFDFPGQPGLSDEKRPPLKAGVYPRWIDETTKALNLKSFHLAGFSMGGLFATEYVITLPQKVKSVALLSPGGLAPARPGFFPRIFPYFFFGKWGIRKINQIISANAPVPPEDDSFSFLVARHFIPVSTTVPVFKDEELKKISLPVLLLAGVKDVILNTACGAKRLKTLVPQAEIHQLKEVGHVLISDQEELLTSFFLKHV